MATLKIWNIEDDLVLFDESETLESLDELLDAFKEENDLDTSGGLAYDFKISIHDDLLMRTDELEDSEGFVVGRYELKA